jgi:hypothetical protein
LTSRIAEGSAREADVVDEGPRCAHGAGRVSRLTITITAKPSGTPNTPAEIGWMPHHSSTGG